jgi:AcrR family transcriptional regulator
MNSSLSDSQLLQVANETPLSLHAAEDEARTERSDAAANRARILKVAERLFARLGVDAVNMIDVAKAAKVGQGTLYRRFANKGELCVALLDAQMREFQDEVFQKLRNMSSERMPPLSQLDWFLDALVHFQARHAPLLCASHAESPAAMMAWMWQRQTIYGLLVAAQRLRHVRADIQIDLLADCIFVMCSPPALNQLRRTQGRPVEQISTGVRQFLRGLGASSEAP